jgi:hypothetical protein
MKKTILILAAVLFSSIVPTDTTFRPIPVAVAAAPFSGNQTVSI